MVGYGLVSLISIMKSTAAKFGVVKILKAIVISVKIVLHFIFFFRIEYSK